ncbi:uncharacterized protein (TIGR00661 family) [Methanohalophilus levihalophilus]|uniref:UDP-N-acetylglucosamine--N-acetylmuramyl- (pentapeptide) pyrophosphoryl-undecaprenol N-acetylglucosamine transferase n=1 Tax=Methanohalophilus levihalophilus TaxID=1431282 RepID=UPI001AE47384|nr:glycosyltransferase family protein [Methanohalophilus levihalophilus]MBP2030126.1 uncharacterized protein (TIGR00661 family) [Methanohalophilus levihalophilus]
MKVFIFVCGEGLGHTARSMSVGKELEKAGHEVLFGAYGYSAEIIQKNGFMVNAIPPEIRLVGDGGSLDMSTSVKESLKLRQIRGLFRVMKMVKREKPDVILSDSYYLGTLSALRYHIPVVLMVNQSNMEEFFKDGFVFRMLGKAARTFYRTVFRKVDNIVVPDFPKPNTICQLNLDFESQIEEKTIYSGPLPAKKPDTVNAEELAKPHVLSLVGGFGYRKPIFLSIIEAAKKDSSINYTMLTGPGIKTEDFDDLPENVNMMPFVPDQYPFLKGSDVVIAPGGHTTMMEALAFGIPVISFPDIGHAEQQNNAKGLETQNCGFRMEYNSSADDIMNRVKECISGKLTSPKNLSALALELEGASEIRKIMETLAGDKRI